MKQRVTTDDLARMIQEDVIGHMVTKNDTTDLKTTITRVENKLSIVIDRELPNHDQRITRIENKLALPKLS